MVLVSTVGFDVVMALLIGEERYRSLTHVLFLYIILNG
jgi:hypothetical protein